MVGQIYDSLARGGLIMIPILGLTFFALVLVFERWLFYRRFDRRVGVFHQRFLDSWCGGRRAEAEAYLKQEVGGLAGMYRSALAHLGKNREQIDALLHQELLDRLEELDRSLPLISTLGSLMPLLGLLGTVTGMITTFDVIRLEGTGNAESLAGGISQALITTQAGLLAAIPLILAHTWLSRKMDRVARAVEKGIARFCVSVE